MENNTQQNETRAGSYMEDPRYKQCNREALYGVILGIVNVLIWAIGGYGLGSGPVESYSYIFGFPAWFFVACIVNAAVAIIGTVFIVKTKMKDMPLEPMTEEQAIAYKERLEGKEARI